MNIEDQVCNLELAKRLKELAACQASHFYWTELDSGWTLWRFDQFLDEKRVIGASRRERYSGFTVAELGDLLPLHVGSYQVEHDDVDVNEDYEPWCCIQYLPVDHSKYKHVVYARTEADARAKMLVHLLRNRA